MVADFVAKLVDERGKSAYWRGGGGLAANRFVGSDGHDVTAMTP